MRVTGPVAAKQALALNRPDAAQIALVRLEGALARLTLNGGRDMITEYSVKDERALGWQRVTAFKPCFFCAMLASRGPTYKSRETADFQAHDHCACTVEAVFRQGQPWAGRGREFQALWNSSTKGASGKSAINAFRRAFEG